MKAQLEKHFAQIELIEHYGAYYKYRIKQDKTTVYTNGSILTFIMDLVKSYMNIFVGKTIWKNNGICSIKDNIGTNIQ